MTNDKSYELSPEDLQKVVTSVELPSCPASAMETLKEAQKDEPDLRQLAKLIAADPMMSAAALKLANSPVFGGRQQVSSVPKAVERLGIKNIVCVVVASALRSSISGLPAAWLEAFWKRTGQQAAAAAMIARQQYGISPDATYTYTLFHNAAMPLMMKRFPDYAEVLDACQREGRLLVEAEERFFPCSHPVVGSLLVRNWGLPAILGQAIRFHHEPDAYDLPDRTLPGGALSFIAVTQVADTLLSQVQESVDVEVGEVLFQRALDYLGIASDDLDDLRQKIAAAITETD